jgi:hypothetical protein
LRDNFLGDNLSGDTFLRDNFLGDTLLWSQIFHKIGENGINLIPGILVQDPNPVQVVEVNPTRLQCGQAERHRSCHSYSGIATAVTYTGM